MLAEFNRFSLKLTRAQAAEGSHSGDCDDDIRHLLTIPAIKRQFTKIDPDHIRAELKEYGAWDEEELSHIEENQRRILWIACGNISEQKGYSTL